MGLNNRAAIRPEFKATGELNLIRAVILRALADHIRNVAADGPVTADQAEPGRWLLDDDPRPYGFVWCCRLIDLDIRSVRLNMSTRRVWEHLVSPLARKHASAPSVRRRSSGLRLNTHFA